MTTSTSSISPADSTRVAYAWAESGSSHAHSSSTAKVAKYFHEYNHDLCENFVSSENLLYREHFKNSQKAIVAAAEGLTGTALLLGVGGALDLPLRELAKQFDCIDLVDMDTKILREVVGSLPVDIRPKFRIHSMDLIGIFSKLDQQIDELVKSGVSHAEFCDKVSEALQTLDKSPLPYIQHSASFVVSSLVSSQLSHKLNEYLDFRSRESYEEPFMRRSNTEMLTFAHSLSRFEEAHMKDLVNLVAPKGKIYFADHFSLQNIESIILQNNRVVKITKKTVGLYSGVKVQELIKKHFKTLHQERWDWTHPFYERERVMIRFPDGEYRQGGNFHHKVFNITSLTLSP